MFRGIPQDLVSAADGVVKGLSSWAEYGSMSVGGEEVEVLINVIERGVVGLVDVDWFGFPGFGWDVDHEGGRFDSGMPHGWNGTHGAYRKSGLEWGMEEAWKA